MSEFEGKVALITGAGRSTGRAVAEALAAQGARVAVNDISPVNLDDTVASITAAGGAAKDYVIDVSKKMPVQSMVEAVLDDWERIDILVNAAAVQPHAPLLDIDEWDWRRAIDVNLNGPFFTIQSVGRVMREGGGGSIVNIVAQPGPAYGLENRAAYVAGKSGLAGLTQEAARELAPYGIRVNAVLPGLLETEKTREMLNASDLRRWLDEIPQGRLARPQDAAELVLFLCSSAAKYLTGLVIPLNSGR